MIFLHNPNIYIIFAAKLKYEYMEALLWHVPKKPSC